MSSKRDLFKGKNKELSEKRRPPLHYVDFSNLMVFTKEDLDKELEKLPDLKLRPDGDSILHRRDSKGNLHSMMSQESLFSLATSGGGDASVASSKSTNQQRNTRSMSVMSVSRPCSSMSFRSFFEMSRSPHSKLDTIVIPIFPYPNPVPKALQHLKMSDLVNTDIDWKMLTLARPPSKRDIEYFTRLVELNKMHHKSKLEDGYGFKRAAFSLTRHPGFIRYNRMRDMTDDLDSMHIDGDYDYEAFARCVPEIDPIAQQQHENEMQEQVVKLLDENFGDNFTIKDETIEKKRRLRNARATSPVQSLKPILEAKTKKAETKEGSDTLAVPGKSPAESIVGKKYRSRSASRATPQIVVTPMNKKE